MPYKFSSELTQNQKLYFLNGRCLSVSPGECTPGFPFRSKREYRRLYFKYRSEILAAVDVSPKDRSPSEDMDWDRLRPASWWEFEGPEKKLFRHNPQAEFDCLTRYGLVNDRDKELMTEIWHERKIPEIRRTCFRIEE